MKAALRSVLPVLLALGALFVSIPEPAAGAAETSGGDEIPDTPADYICSNSQLSTLCRIITAANGGIGATALKDSTAIETIFAPTDDAFDKDSRSVAGKLKLKDFADIFTDPTAADRLLRALILPDQALLSSAFKSGREYKNLLKQDLEYQTAWLTSQVYVEGSRRAEITTKDIRAGQAVIHVVSRVPYP